MKRRTAGKTTVQLRPLTLEDRIRGGLVGGAVGTDSPPSEK